MRIGFRCRQCGVKLVGTNQYPYDKKANRRICQRCTRTNARYYYETHLEEARDKNRDYTKTHREERKEYQAERRDKTKLAVLSHYSGTSPPQCANPFGIHKESFAILEALTLDHINNDGAKDREVVSGNRRSGGQRFYEWLVRNEYPNKSLQVLCWNCQWIKRIRAMRNQIVK